MRIFDANITISTIEFFKQNQVLSLELMNQKLKSVCGVNSFFDSQFEVDNLLSKIINNHSIVDKIDRTEYGDFQTNENLSNNICNLLKEENISPEIILEPTCGKGNFIISSLKVFKDIKYIYGIEIYKPYIWETKFSILDYFLNNKTDSLPEINIFHQNVFNFDFNKISIHHKHQSILVIGNPPWVTNSKLSTLNSKNLPQKSNFKKHKGLDAITGKANFDIGEYISIKLLSIFSKLNGSFAFLIKNSVVKNILLEQKHLNHSISNIKQFNINTKKEFNVSVNACLFTCIFNKNPEYTISEYDFYSNKHLKKYGWINKKFVANIKSYVTTESLDGKFPFNWRQGVKHDASKIMELERKNGYYRNNKDETVDIENDLIYCLLKSSDLKESTIDTSRKYTIITQKKIGQETKYIKEQYPKTFNYLSSNIEYFNKRKSSIYKGKPKFSIFGIGDYSFKPFKVAISGMYKTTKFVLVKSNNSKPIMLDDTCYFVGFDTLIDAQITQFLLNKEVTQAFINSIVFLDAKRMITKDILMRIDLFEIIKNTKFSELQTEIFEINNKNWEDYKYKIIEKRYKENQQLHLWDTTNYIQQAI